MNTVMPPDAAEKERLRRAMIEERRAKVSTEKERLRLAMIEERRAKVSNAVAFAKGTKFDGSSSSPPRTSSTTFDHKKLQQQHKKGNSDDDMEAAEAYFTESEELRVNKPYQEQRRSTSRSSNKQNPRVSRVTMLGESDPSFKDEHSSDTLGHANDSRSSSKYYVDKKQQHKNRSLFDCKTCVIATILFTIFSGGIIGVVVGMVVNNGDSSSTSSVAPAENATANETMAPTESVTSVPVDGECTVKTQHSFPKMTTMTLYLGVKSNTTLDDVQYVANMLGKSYTMSVGSEDVCDSFCREIVETTVISSIRVDDPNENMDDAEDECPETMKLVVNVEGTYFGCGGDFPGLFGVPSHEDHVVDDGKRRQLAEKTLPLIRRRVQEESAMCSCVDTATGKSAVTEQAHEMKLIEQINSMLEVVPGVCIVKSVGDTSGGALIGGIYVAPP